MNKLFDGKGHKEPPNTEENRQTLTSIILNDMSLKEMRRRVKEQIVNSYKGSTRKFLADYWDYFEETGGHCPFGINSD
jgi:hypothetical protein